MPTLGRQRSTPVPAPRQSLRMQAVPSGSLQHHLHKQRATVSIPLSVVDDDGGDVLGASSCSTSSRASCPMAASESHACAASLLYQAAADEGKWQELCRGDAVPVASTAAAKAAIRKGSFVAAPQAGRQHA